MVGGIQRHWLESLEPGQWPFVENHSLGEALAVCGDVCALGHGSTAAIGIATFIGDVVIAVYILDLYWLVQEQVAVGRFTLRSG